MTDALCWLVFVLTLSLWLRCRMAPRFLEYARHGFLNPQLKPAARRLSQKFIVRPWHRGITLTPSWAPHRTSVLHPQTPAQPSSYWRLSGTHRATKPSTPAALQLYLPSPDPFHPNYNPFCRFGGTGKAASSFLPLCSHLPPPPRHTD